MKSLETLDLEKWEDSISANVQNRAVHALEDGKVLFLPRLSFHLSREELGLLSPDIVDPKAKNISYDLRHDRLAGTRLHGEDERLLKEMVKRYAITSRKFLEKLIPGYARHLIQAKTSFRPVEILGRKSSYRKDDTLLHVDSFPSNPTKGLRILRVFTNINPNGQPRVWRVGEPFGDVVAKIGPKVSSPIPGVAQFLKLLGITKDYRTQYDHYMLQLHDRMKGSPAYQGSVPQEEIRFPAHSSWIVYTDQVSHAAMSGQHVLEQTFYLPVNALNNEATAPLRVLEKYLSKALV